MTHLNEDQLSAYLDGALTGTQADAATAHLASCELCSAQLAEIAALESNMKNALTHDPGEAYFASFADRVSERIAAVSAPAAAPARAAGASAAAPRRSWWQNLFTPRGMMLAGAAAAFVIVAALAVQLQSHGPQEIAALQAPQSSVPASPRNEAAAPKAEATPAPEAEATPAPEAGATPAPAAPAQSAAKDAAPKDAPHMAAEQKASVPPAALLDRLAKKEAQATNAPDRTAQSGRAQEMRTLENGEQVPVSRGPAAAQRAEAARLQDASGGAFRKPAATPLGAQGAQGFAAAPAPVPAPVTVGRTLAEKSIAPANKQRDDKAADGLSLNAIAPRAGGAQPARQQEEDGAAQQAPPMALRLCGRVADPQGRAIPAAVVTLSESGVSTRSDADGSFCVDSPNLSGTVLVFAVGYEPYRYTIHGSASAQALSATLTPISPLGKGPAGALAKLKTSPAPSAADPFAGASVAARAAVAGAQKAETAAAPAHSAGAWSLTAAQWTQAATLLTGAAAHEARFRAAAARMQVLPLAPDAMEPLAAARAALQSFLASAPKGAQREQAQRWLASIKR